MEKRKRRLLRFMILTFKILLPLGAGCYGVILGLNTFNNENPHYFDDDNEQYFDNPYISPTLTLDSSRIVDALMSEKKSVYTKRELFNPDITQNVHNFFQKYKSDQTYNNNSLTTLKTELELLMTIVYQHTRGFNGKPLNIIDKNHYLTLYRLRDIDREITRELLGRGIDSTTFFQKPKAIPTGKGKWNLQILEPESPELFAYYEMVSSSQFISDIVHNINSLFLFDKEHNVSFLECWENPLPIYDRVNKNINICYSQLYFIEKIFYDTFKSEEEITSQILDIVGMVLLREFGHAFFDIFDIPYSGKIEDSVDQLAVVLIAETFDFEWDDIQKKVMAYTKAFISHT